MSDNVVDFRGFANEMTKGNQAKDDMVMMLEPFNNMSAQLGAAPLCISILGQLCVIATGTDFSLIDRANPTKEFKFLVEPSSYRASLCQVSNEGYRAFQEADRVMDVVRLSTYQVPALMTQSLNILFKAAPHEVEHHLPITLGRIKEIADSCTNEAQSVVDQYNRVIDTLHELQISSLAAQGRTKEAKEMADSEAKQKREEMNALDEMKTKIDHDAKVLEKSINEAREQYKEALNNMPTASTLIGLAVVDSICSTLDSLTVGISARSARSDGTVVNPRANPDCVKVISLSTGEEILFKLGKQLENFIEKMDEFFEETHDGRKLNERVIQGKKGNSAKDVEYSIQSVERSIEAEKEEENNLKKNLLKICKAAKFLLAAFKEAAMKGGATNLQVEDLENRLEKLNREIKSINVTLSTRSNIPPIHKQGPGLQQKTKNEGGSSLVNKALESAHTKLQVTKEQLKSVQNEADKAMERQLDVNRRLQENLRDLAKFEADGAKQSEILEVVQQGLKAFGQLKKQWTKMLAFFQAMSTLINTSLGPPLKMFVEYAGQTSKNRQIGLEASDFGKELVYQPAYQAVKVAYLVHNLSGSYCEISRDHLMPLVSRLGIMISYDSVTEKKKIAKEKNDLQLNALKMQKVIESIVKNKNEQFHQQVDQRMTAIENEFKKKIPKISEEKKKEIESFVHEAAVKGNSGDELNFDDWA